MKLSVELVNSNGENLLKKELEVKGSEWQKLTAVLKAPFTDVRSRLRVVLQTEGTVDMDHISLFPVNTWKKRENGLRADLVQALYDLNPGVFRFPGGCIIEGNSLATRYQWKNSVGPVENRPLNENRWNYTFKHKAFPDYFQSYGLGFYEYFLLSEDLGAEPLPVLSCGLSCQYESNEVVPWRTRPVRAGCPRPHRVCQRCCNLQVGKGACRYGTSRTVRSENDCHRQ